MFIFARNYKILIYRPHQKLCNSFKNITAALEPLFKSDLYGKPSGTKVRCAALERARISLDWNASLKQYPTSWKCCVVIFILSILYKYFVEFVMWNVEFNKGEPKRWVFFPFTLQRHFHDFVLIEVFKFTFQFSFACSATKRHK